MNRIIMLLAAVTMFVGCNCKNGVKINDLSVTSPDGRNQIRLYVCETGVAYEVIRDGVVVVAKSSIGMKINGRCLTKAAKVESTDTDTYSGKVSVAVYKKSEIDLAHSENFVDFGDWGIRLVARNDGVAYRFETKFPDKVTVDCEKASVTIPNEDARCWACPTGHFGCEESRAEGMSAKNLKSNSKWLKGRMAYLPFAYSIGGKFIVVTEADVRDYPIWNLESSSEESTGVSLGSRFAGWPKKTEKHRRNIRILEYEDFLVKTEGTRTYPWRTFVLSDSPAKVCEADIVYALAAESDAAADFGWVKPGKVAWDWWNCFDNLGGAKGCNTKTYKRFIDFAAKTGVEYVILDEGWSSNLNIWKFRSCVDVPHLIDYGNKKGVGIILWMAWSQVYGDEEHIAEHFAKLGAKGFKVDFMDRGDAEVANFLEKFAAACAKHKMLVDYHGAYRPVGLQRKYPNVLNYEGIHGLENLKWFGYGEEALMSSDVRAVFLRLTAGPMDYTPGAMLNHAIGTGYLGRKAKYTPGSIGTRCRQMAMMALYEAPLQMLCDSPTNYEKNMESFSFMAKVPVVWDNTIGLGGDPDGLVAVARKARDGSWCAAGITDAEQRDFTVDTSFLGEGEWQVESFRDAADANVEGTHYVHDTGRVIKAGEKLTFRMAKGGGFVVKFIKL